MTQKTDELCLKHFDKEVGKDFNYFICKLNERVEWQYGLRDSYNAPENVPALGPDVEYFHFMI